MARGSSKLETLSQEQRSIVLGSSIVNIGMLTLSASFSYMLNDMVGDLGATDEQAALMRQIASIGSLLVVFLAGVLGERLGERRVIAVTAVAFALGSLVVALAPNIVVASAGLLLANVAKATIAVVGIAYVTVQIRDKDGRATAFSAISSVQPMAYLVMPLLAGLLVATLSWRLVALVWVIGGLAAMVAARRLFPPDTARAPVSGEMLTPALAGLALAMFVQLFGSARQDGITTQWWIQLAIGVTALVALIVLYRRLATPTLSLAPLKHGGLMLLLLVVVLMSFVNLYYYSLTLFQVVYGYSAFTTAILMIPAQLAGILSAIVVRKILVRKGVTFVGTLAIGFMAVTLLLSTLLQPGTPILFPIIVVTLYGFGSLAAVITMTNAVMDLSRKGDEGDTSSYKSAATSVGMAIGISVMTFVTTTVGFASFNSQMEAAGIPPAEVSAAGWDLLYGATPQDVSDQYAIPIDEVNEIGDMEKTAYVQAYRAQGLVGAVVAGIAALLFYVIRRRTKRLDAAQERSSP